MAHAGGQPTKYRQEYNEEALKYFDIDAYYETPVTTTTKDGQVVEKMKLIANDFPNIAGLARRLKVDRETLYEWAKVHPEFSNTLNKCRSMEADILVTNGLKGLYSQPFAIMAAKNIIGWRDKQDVEHSGGITVSFHQSLKQDEGQ